MPTIARIVAVEFRCYPDKSIAEDRVIVTWRDRHGAFGRTEGLYANPHIAALVARATREGAEFRSCSGDAPHIAC